MKYIRTIDGRIAEIKEDMFVKQSDVLRLCYKDRPFVSVLQGDGDEVIKQDNTIEELCDEFVVDSKINNVHYTMDWFDLCEELADDRLYPTDEIYGAIWTSKGLIYVAKMNKKGDLELI